jgi:hypothetical protein
MSLKDIVRINGLTDTDWSVDVKHITTLTIKTIMSALKVLTYIFTTMTAVSFEGVDIHFHYYHSCQFWRCWHTFSLLSQLSALKVVTYIFTTTTAVSFEDVDIHFHYYDSCQFWRCWHTFSLLSQLFLSDSTDNVSLDHDNWDFFYIKQGDDIFDCLDWFVSLNERQVLLWLLIKAGERWKSVNYTMGYRICLVISQKFGSENMLSRKFFYFYMWVWTSLDITKSGQFLPGILTIDE